MMTYISDDEHGWKFMCLLKNVVYHSSNCCFDKDFFSKCSDNKGKVLQHPDNGQKPPKDNDNHSGGPSVNDNDDVPPPWPISH